MLLSRAIPGNSWLGIKNVTEYRKKLVNEVRGDLLKSIFKIKCLKWHEERVDGLRVQRGRLALAILPEVIIINAIPELIIQLVLLKVCWECREGEGQQMSRLADDS